MTFTGNVRAKSDRESAGISRRTHAERVSFAAILARFPHRYLLTMTVSVAVLYCLSAYVYAFDPDPPPPPPNVPPLIVDFAGTMGASEWTFDGQVIDENPVGLVITFGGLLAGHQTTVHDSDGYFQYTVQLQGPGTVTAHTVDDHQQGSNDATYYVQ